nr:MAG TPA: hypothetical protein [Caudoviricetes sp.]
MCISPFMYILVIKETVICAWRNDLLRHLL